jgi:cytochrome c biogenesis protein CcmG, thiol:disulfide interchange protein DsbE
MSDTPTSTLDRPDPPPRPAAPRRRPVMVATLSVLAAFLLVVVLVIVGGDDPSGSRQGLIGQQVPDVELVTLDGEPFQLSSLQGQRVIVNFFNDWCAPCQEELPNILAFNVTHADDQSFQFVWIAREYEASAIRRWVDAVDPPGIVLLDPGEDASEAFHTTGQPETYGVRPDGTVATFYTGPILVRDLEDILLAAGSPAAAAG